MEARQIRRKRERNLNEVAEYLVPYKRQRVENMDIMDIIQQDLLDHATTGEECDRSDPSVECACDIHAILGLYECPVHKHSEQVQPTHDDDIIPPDDPIVIPNDEPDNPIVIPDDEPDNPIVIPDEDLDDDVIIIPDEDPDDDIIIIPDADDENLLDRNCLSAVKENKVHGNENCGEGSSQE